MTESDGLPLLVWQIVERYWAEVTLRHAASQTKRDFRDHYLSTYKGLNLDVSNV